MELLDHYFTTFDWRGQYIGKTFTDDLVMAKIGRVITAPIFAKQSGVIVAGDET